MIGIDLSDWLHHTKSLQRIGEDGCDIISFFLGSHFRVRSALKEVSCVPELKAYNRMDPIAGMVRPHLGMMPHVVG